MEGRTVRVGPNVMSAITTTIPTSPAVGLNWIPSPLYRITLEQFEAMISSGAFTKRDRVHLINGYLVARMTELPAHGAACDAIHLSLEPLLPAGWYVRTERVIRVPSHSSMPEPDVVVVGGTWREYANRYPEPTDIAMIVEVANSSLNDDPAMAGIYGSAGVSSYWIINLVDRQVEVYSDPFPGGYRSRLDHKPGQVVPVVVDGKPVGTIAVDDLLP
jgi:Uma2 family endonuclease